MVNFSVRFSYKKLIGSCLLIALAFLATSSVLGIVKDRKATIAVAAGEIPFKAGAQLEDNASRLDFMRSLGWETDEEPAEIAEVLIPEEFGEVYTKYNELQKAQGCDLEKYKGKRIKRYTYIINNYPTGEVNVRINLLMYKNRLIAGDVCSVKLDGFMQGLAKTSAKNE